ncbi:MAG: hypothetical protein LQ340_000035 [Diploschistes diacapsis]|nr:MAG: hypothetical protein LQ340_000035 [Diploschistes diacapsis]
MVASLVRVVITTNGSQTDDLTWMGAWAGIEMGVAIIVSCLCSFRTLFTSRVRSGRVSAYEAYRASKSFHCRGLPQSRQRQTLYRLGSFLTQNGKYADAKATVERGDRHDADTRQLHELDKSNFGKALVQKPCTVRDELAPVCHGPMPIRSIPAGVDADTDLTEKSWLDIESQEAEESPKSQNKTHDQG